MNQRKKRILSAVLFLTMMVSLAACAAPPQTPDTQTQPPATATAAPDQTGTPQQPATGSLATGEGATIQIWHTRGSGANAEQMTASIQKFNETNTLGITVEEVFQGGYVDTLAKTMQSVAAGNNPELVVLERAAGVPVMAEQNVLADMTPFVQRDGFDVDNVLPVLLGYSYYNGEMISMPYIRSVPVFFYNKTMFASAGLDQAPKTIEQLKTAGEKIFADTGVPAFEMLNDPAWFVQNMLCQLGSNMLSEDGQSAPCLEDGTLLKTLSAWREWVDAGWCAPFTVTEAESTMKESFNQGRLGSFFASSGGTTNTLKNARAAGIDIGVAMLPTWDKDAAPTGGGNIAIMKANKDENQIAAAWEFVKFLLTDEQVAQNAINTGYLPVTKSASENAEMKAFWEANPEYRVAYDQLFIAQEMPWSKYKSEFEEALRVVCSKLIVDRSITAEQAVEEMKVEASIIFP